MVPVPILLKLELQVSCTKFSSTALAYHIARIPTAYISPKLPRPPHDSLFFRYIMYVLQVLNLVAVLQYLYTFF